jgi:coenzyme F420-0:L-glutamate ligase/coenzyme F420-1:gamma-L-glutamate ligase
MVNEIRIIPVRGMGEVTPGDDLARLLLDALAQQQQPLEQGDVVVVTQKIVSKAEGRVVDLEQIEPSPFAHQIARLGHKDAAYYEIVLRESRRIVRMDRGILITETQHGLICANAGVDESNVAGGRMVTLLPIDSDASAVALRTAIHERTGCEVAVIISDTFGRAWREGQVNIAIGVAGIPPLIDYAGMNDPYGMTLHASMLAIADELASAAELAMGKIDGVPIALIRGYPFPSSNLTAQALIRPPERDLFR